MGYVSFTIVGAEVDLLLIHYLLDRCINNTTCSFNLVGTIPGNGFFIICNARAKFKQDFQDFHATKYVTQIVNQCS